MRHINRKMGEFIRPAITKSVGNATMLLEEPIKHTNLKDFCFNRNFHNKPRKERTNQGHKSILGLLVNEKLKQNGLHIAGCEASLWLHAELSTTISILVC